MIQIDRLQEIGERSRTVSPPSTHGAEWSPASCVEELSADYSLSGDVKKCKERGEIELSLEVLGSQRGVKTRGTLIDRNVIANRIILIIICGFQNLRLVQSFYSCVMRLASEVR